MKATEPTVMRRSRVTACERRGPGWVVTLEDGCVFLDLVEAREVGSEPLHECVLVERSVG
jgi:hypothetical protein